MLLKCPKCNQTIADLKNVSWVCEGCGTKNGPINIMMTTCEKCGKELDYLSCHSCKVQIRVSDIMDRMFPSQLKGEGSMNRLTLMDIYTNSNREGVFVTAPDVQSIPKVIWNYDICQQLPSATSSRYRSAVLTRSYLGGMRDGRPFKQSYVFMYYSDPSPTERSKPVGSLTFTIDLTDGSIRFVESPMEF